MTTAPRSPADVYWVRCHAMMSVVLDGRGGDDSKPLMIQGTPRTASVCRNGYHDADTWSLEFDARALPFDPEIIRSCAVAIYMFTASGLGDRREWAIPDYEMVRGLADDDGIELSDNGQSVTISGRDYTGLLLDKEWDPTKQIPYGIPLDQQVQAIADAAAPPGAALKFRVVWDVEESLFEKLSLAGGKPKVGAQHRSTKRKGLWVRPGKTYWDVIYEMTLSCGLNAFVRGEEIIIRAPNTQTTASVAKAPKLVYGRNLMSLNAKRKLTREKVPTIQVVGFDPAVGQVSAIYPENANEAAAVGVQLKTKVAKVDKNALGIVSSEILLVNAPQGVVDKATLKQIAKARFVSMARAETSYRAETKHLEALDGEDLLRLNAGDPVSIMFDPFNKEQMNSLSVEQRVDHLLDLGYSAQISRYIATYYDRLDQYRAPHYIHSAEYEWAAGEDGAGITIGIESVNYAYEPREAERSDSP